MRSRLCPAGIQLFLAVASFGFFAQLHAQVAPAPGWCSMGHCNPQMTDYVAQQPPGISGNVYVKTSDEWNSGVSSGDGCVSNGKYVACAYKQSWNAIVVYDGNGNIIWASGALLDEHTFAGMPIIESDGSLIAGDDQHVYGFNPDGSVAWATASPGGSPIGLVPTQNGAIVAATAGQQLDECWQNNCTLGFIVNNGGTGYTTATVSLSGGYCPGASASATIVNGAITSVTTTTQGTPCQVIPDVIVMGDGVGASVSATLLGAAPVSVYSGGPSNTGALIGSTYLYQYGNSGPYYATINTPCVNNAQFPNRVYIISALQSDSTQGAVWALDIDPNNLASPITPAWDLTFHGPSGASPLCVGNHIYFDGAGITPGDNVGTTIFGVQDNGSSGSFLFQVPLGSGSEDVTCNFALDPRPVGGFWHQLRYDPNIYHRDFTTGNLLEIVNVSNLLVAGGAPPATYWQGGIFTTYGTSTRPYLMLPEVARPGSLGYFTMLDIAAQQLVWMLPLAGNEYGRYDTPGGDAALVLDSNNNPVMVMAGKQTGAYFIANGGPVGKLSATSLTFGSQTAGTTSEVQSVSLTNSASGTLNIGNIAASAGFHQSNTCGASLAPGVACTINVTFNPTSVGSKTGTVTVSGNNQSGPLTLQLSGIGTGAVPVATLSKTKLTFGAQPAGTVSSARPVTLTNTGNGPLSITGITSGGAGAQTNNCPTSLAPATTCTINVMLSAPPSGACSGSVTVVSNSQGGPQSVTLSGTCTSVPPVESSLSTSSLVFMPQTAGTISVPQPLTLANIGTQTLNVSSISVSGEVGQSNNCDANLAPGASCVISVVFAPAGLGARSGTVTVVDSAPDSPHLVAATGVGLANPVPLIYQPLAPSAVVPGTAGVSLTVNGSSFVPGAAVYWNGAPRVTVYRGSTQLSATLLPSDLTSATTGSISVVNPNPGGGQSNVLWLPVSYPSPAPVWSSATIRDAGGPSAVTATDWNLDGKLDLAVTNSHANTVSILLGNGDGTFATAVDYPTGSQPVAIASADLNRDGISDLVIANQSDNTVSVLLGSGSGTFGQQKPYPTGNFPTSVVLADFNGDGSLDIAVTNLVDNSVSVLFGNGDGTFDPRLDYNAGASPVALSAGDFNGDGKLDLAVADDFTPNGTVTILLNHGDGSFVAGVPYPTADSVSLTTADFNGDGHLDFAAVNDLAQSLSIYLGHGDGTFTVGPNQSTRLSPNPVAIAAADVTADGSLELVTAYNGSTGLLTLQNDFAGTFSVIEDYGGVAGLTALAIGDFNNDGSIDVAGTAPGTNGIAIALQAPTVTLSTTSLGFGSVKIGTTASQNIVLTNAGSAVLKISSISAGGGTVFSQSNDCVSAGPIVPGTSCTITVNFTPTATGLQTIGMTIRDNAPGGSQTVTLSGVGATLTLAVNLAQNPVTGGGVASGNSITVSNPAPPSGYTITLTSSNQAVAAVPPSVVVASGGLFPRTSASAHRRCLYRPQSPSQPS